MIYKANYRTRWHDTDFARVVRPTQLLVYMQETSNRHIASSGVTLEQLRDERGLAFILSKIKLAIHKPLYAYEEIAVETWTADVGGFSSLRYFRITRGEDIIAECESTWALVGLEDRKLHRFCEITEGWENHDAIDVGLPRRFRVPRSEELELVGKRRIVYSDLDYNMHMNNTKYADMLCDFISLEEIHQIKGMSLSYLHEAAFGDTVSVLCKREGGRCLFRTVNEAGDTCLEAEIII